jgi:hypothetical protein
MYSPASAIFAVNATEIKFAQNTARAKCNARRRSERVPCGTLGEFKVAEIGSKSQTDA